ncbi:MAG: hypothetical protein LDLANPLL_00011 [Turneriella sp.]|nr:hypothetical protein [Turneriella sp.]
MKKLKIASLFAVFALVATPALMADGLEIKAGVGSVKAASDRAGFDAGIGYSIGIERFFAIVPEVNFNWLNFDGSLGSGSAGQSGLSGGSTPSSSFYTLPVLLNARILIPMGGDETPVVQPIITAGAGYGWSHYSYSYAGNSSKTDLSGFMYQASLGMLINLGMISEGSASSTSILVEAGYRGGTLAYSGTNYDWSGYVVRAGVNLGF